MAKKKTKNNMNLPTWVKSKYFMLTVALVLAGVAVVGYRSFAGGVTPGTPGYSVPHSCLSTTYKQTSPYMSGECVKWGQKMLNYVCKNSALTVDGIYGPSTKGRVQGYQYYNIGSPSATGVLNPTTWNKLHYVSGSAAYYKKLNCAY